MESSTVIIFRALVMLACLIIVPLAAIFGSQFPDLVKSLLVERILPTSVQTLLAQNAPAAFSSPAESDSSADPWQSEAAPALSSPNAESAPARSGLTSAPPWSNSSVEPAVAWEGSGQVHHALDTGSSLPGAQQPLNQPDRFSILEDRLKQAGATYYLLETWGTDGEQYRFHCKMAIANNPGRTRHFECTDTDPLRAMGRVVEQVDAWRRQASGMAR